jgi:hypothetical protein
MIFNKKYNLLDIKIYNKGTLSKPFDCKLLLGTLKNNQTTFDSKGKEIELAFILYYKRSEQSRLYNFHLSLKTVRISANKT